MKMTPQKIAVMQLLAAITPGDGAAMEATYEALAHGIALLSTTTGDLQLQAETLKRTFDYTVEQAALAMESFAHFVSATRAGVPLNG